MSTWSILRAAGVGAYLMLFAAVAWGLVATTGLVSKRVAKATSVLIHQVLGSVALALLVIHLGGLLLDEFAELEPLDLLVPLREKKERPIGVALGVVGMYVLLIVLLTSWIRKGLGTSWWRRFHLFATPAFVLALMHGMVAGTDTKSPWMWWTYVATGLCVVFLLLVRALTGRGRRGGTEMRGREPSPPREPAEEADPVGAGATS